MKRLVHCLISALALGLVAGVSAQENPASALTKGGGLLGESYAGFTYDWLKLDNSPVDASGFTLEVNHPLRGSWDLNFQYSYWRTESFAGIRGTVQVGGLGVRFHSAKNSSVRPYIGAGAGWASAKAGGISDSAFAWQAEVGVEFQAGNKLTVTPVINYQDTGDIFGSSGGTTNYGVKANYWLNEKFGLRAGIMGDDDSNVTYSIGFNLHF